MKRREILRILAQHGAELVREGGGHTIYRNPRTGKAFAVPRHTEIKEPTARAIIKAAEE